MLLPTENSAFSLSIAMMLGADRMFVLTCVASAWNSIAYDGMLVPRNVCEFVSGAPTMPPIRPVATRATPALSDLSVRRLHAAEHERVAAVDRDAAVRARADVELLVELRPRGSSPR